MTCNIIQGLKINRLVTHGAVASTEGNISAYREPSVRYLWGRRTEYFVPSPPPLLRSKNLSCMEENNMNQKINIYIFLLSNHSWQIRSTFLEEKLL